jgi:hypothetical protein
MLKPINSAFSQWLNRIRQLPQTLILTTKERQRQAVLNTNEAERLDRIRNPDKYRGK